MSAYGPLADLSVVLAYRANPAREVFYKPTRYRPVFSRIFARACKTSRSALLRYANEKTK
jgi:hypothetical protein